MGNGPCTGTLSFGYDAILLMDINGYRRNATALPVRRMRALRSLSLLATHKLLLYCTAIVTVFESTFAPVCGSVTLMINGTASPVGTPAGT